MKIEWDTNKERLNIKKHKVSFEEASSAFYDRYSRIINDPEHSATEDRFLLLGLSEKARVLLVCHCYKQNEVIRIISARKADKQEIDYYYKRR